jgi:hypothetical protein
MTDENDEEEEEEKTNVSETSVCFRKNTTREAAERKE